LKRRRYIVEPPMPHEMNMAKKTKIPTTTQFAVWAVYFVGPATRK
jgi:hypothetical protein